MSAVDSYLSHYPHPNHDKRYARGASGVHAKMVAECACNAIGRQCTTNVCPRLSLWPVSFSIIVTARVPCGPTASRLGFLYGGWGPDPRSIRAKRGGESLQHFRTQLSSVLVKNHRSLCRARESTPSSNSSSTCEWVSTASHKSADPSRGHQWNPMDTWTHLSPGTIMSTLNSGFQPCTTEQRFELSKC